MAEELTPVHCLHGQGRRPECILCGRCLPACPLFIATGREELSPRSKFFLARAVAEGRAELSKKAADILATVCLSCGKCENACPLGLCGPDLVAELRASHPGFAGFLWKLWIEQAGLMWPLARTLTKLVPGKVPVETVSRAKAAIEAMGAGKAPEPWIFPETFETAHAGKKCVIFAGCVAEHANPQWKKTAKRLLTGLGLDVLPDPGFTCCGCTLGHAGAPEAQAAMQQQNIEAWRKAGRPLMVVFCATCRCGLRAYARKDLGLAMDEIGLWRENLVSLAELMGGTSFRLGEAAPAHVRYHRPCHGAGGNQDLTFLRRAMGDRIVFRESETPCCGFGGLTKLTSPELSDAVAAHALAVYDPAPGDQIVTGCAGCVTQLRSVAPKEITVGHWLECIG
ncbi:MAG: (Fe-S)-binding protein [Desulfovibrio sp.]